MGEKTRGSTPYPKGKAEAKTNLMTRGSPIEIEEQVRVSLMGLRDWRRTSIEQKASANTIKDLDEGIEAQEKKLASLEGRKIFIKRPGGTIPEDNDMGTE